MLLRLLVTCTALAASVIADSLYAHCQVGPHSRHGRGPRGHFCFRQQEDGDLEIRAMLRGFNPEEGHSHEVHVHEYGDLHLGCNSLGGHFNPEGADHGEPGDGHRHAGDLGVIECDDDGRASTSFSDPVAKLGGPASIIGRSIAVHGVGGIIGCCVIGHTSSETWEEMERMVAISASHGHNHGGHDHGGHGHGGHSHGGHEGHN